jgi:hypothetical protein
VECFPGLAEAKSFKEKNPSPDMITPIRLQEGCYLLRVLSGTALGVPFNNWEIPT